MVVFFSILVGPGAAQAAQMAEQSYQLCGGAALCAQGAVRRHGLWAYMYGVLRGRDSLAAKLCPEGARETVTDSELALHAYMRWGEDFLEHLQGVASAAVYDEDRDLLIAFVDRMGNLPVFYARTSQGVAVADHIDGLLALPGVRPVVDTAGIRLLFGLGPAREPGSTPFAGVRQLLPGHVLRVHRGELKTRAYYALPVREGECDEAQALETTRALVEQAVADVAPLAPASLLSGGVDSTVLTALMCERLGAPIDTYSLDYEGNREHFQGSAYQPSEDAPWVARAVEHIGTNHARVELSIESLLAAMEQAMRARGWPGMGDIDSSLLLLCREVGLRHDYALSGECGDEVFGGYPWFHREPLIEADGFPWSGSLALREQILTPELSDALALRSYAADVYQQALRRQPVVPGESARETRLRQLQGLCFEFFMANLQERALRMGQAAGVTLLTPFCDERIVEFAYNARWALKNMRGQEKGMLRASMVGLLPDDMLWRKKSPFPKTHHPKYAQLVSAALREALARPDSPLRPLLNEDFLSGQLGSEQSPVARPWYGQLMTGPQMFAYLLQIDQWMRAYRVRLEL